MNRSGYQKRLAAEGFFFRPTSDDWYPTFPDGTVAIIAFPNHNETRWRVVIKGGDDTSMERDHVSRDEALRTLAGLPSIITRDDLEDRGFSYG